MQQDSLEAIREEIENPAEITSTEELNRDRIAEIDKELSTFVTAFSALSSEEKNKYRYVMYFYGNDLTKKLLGQHKPDFDPVAAAKKEKPDVKPFKTFEEYKANIEMADEMYGAPADDAFDVSDEEAAEARAELTREQMKKELEEFAVKVIKELEGNEAFIKLLTGGEQEALGKYIFIAWAYENGIELIKEILEEHTEGFDPIAAAKSKRPGETPKISFEVLNEM